MRRFIAMIIVVLILLISVPLAYFGATRSGVDRVEKSFGPVVIDGVYSAAEWGDAAHQNYTLTVNGYGSGHSQYCPNHTKNSTEEEHAVDGYQKTSATTFFICVRIFNEDFNCQNTIRSYGAENEYYSDQLYLCFDVNLDGFIGWPRKYWNETVNGTTEYFWNYTADGCYDDIKGLAVGIPEDQPWNPSYWKGKIIDTYGYGPPSPPLEEGYVHTGYPQGQGTGQGQGPGQGQGQGQSFLESPFGNGDQRRRNDNVSFEAAFSHTNPVENALGEYTFEFAIPLRGDKYDNISIDLDNKPGDTKKMGIIIKYYDARIYKEIPSGEIGLNDPEMLYYWP